MYKIVLEKKAIKELAKITLPYYNNIIDAIKNLASNPRPIGYKKLKGRTGYRIRVADYRIIYTIQDDILTVFVLTLAHRKDVYE